MPTKRESVFLLTRSLDLGGAQRQLGVLARGLRERGHPVQVGVFYAGGAVAAELIESGIEVVDLGKGGRWDLLSFMRRLIGELRRRRPDVLYSFLGSANIVASAARPFVQRSRLVWSVRASNMDLTHYDWAHRVSYLVERSLSNSPDLIIANSQAGADFAAGNGFPRKKIIVIPNGIDTDRFRPDARLRIEQRRTFGLKDTDIAVGVLARLDPMKGQAIFLRAAKIAAEKKPELRFLCIGHGPDLDRLRHLAEELGLSGRHMITGEQDPVAALNALDILCSCSLWGEGFSNAIAEGMACGLPCIVTDVGDSAAIVGDAGTVVPAGSPDALAEAILATTSSIDRHDPDLPRARVIRDFSVAAMIDRTLAGFRTIREGRRIEADPH